VEKLLIPAVRGKVRGQGRKGKGIPPTLTGAIRVRPVPEVIQRRRSMRTLAVIEKGMRRNFSGRRMS
jgi:hypothetical protein